MPGQQGTPPPPPPQIVVLVMVVAAAVAMGDGGCLSDPSPIVLSPALLIHAAARHCGSEGGRAERTAVNEFRRNRDSPLYSLSVSPLSPPLSLLLPLISHGCLSCATVSQECGSLMLHHGKIQFLFNTHTQAPCNDT